jgi:hypothetical protein
MAAKLKLISGSTIRWGARRFVVVDYVGAPVTLDAVIAREVGKRELERISVRVANPDRVVVGEVLNRIDGVSHWKIITDPRFSFANSGWSARRRSLPCVY